MPSSNNRLRRKFMVNGSDGIQEAEDIIKNAGGKVERGMITPPSLENKTKKQIKEIGDAIDYLLWEWDYGFKD